MKWYIEFPVFLFVIFLFTAAFRYWGFDEWTVGFWSAVAGMIVLNTSKQMKDS